MNRASGRALKKVLIGAVDRYHAASPFDRYLLSPSLVFCEKPGVMSAYAHIQGLLQEPSDTENIRFQLSERQPKRPRSLSEDADQPAKRRRGADDSDNLTVHGAGNGPSSIAMFSGVQSAQTSGGVFTVVGGDYVTIRNYNTCHCPPRFRNQTLQRRQRHAEKITSVQRERNYVSRTRASSFEIGPPSQDLFPQIQQSLEFIKNLIQPGPAPSLEACKGISGDLRELDELVKISSLTYQACDASTLVGRMMRGFIDTRMLQCKTVLMGVHQDLADFLYRYPSPSPFSFRVIYRWWTGSECEEIAAARLALRLEARAIGGWLCNMRL